MYVNRSLKLILCTLALWLGASGQALLAQSYEEQARAILALFESGNKDSAYALVEPLKKQARFVPAVLYTRAQMTPDDRALNLYREAIALEPGGPYADKACAALVARYVEKRDSAAARAWLHVMQTNYPRSALLTPAQQLVESTADWIDFDAGSRSPLSDTARRTRTVPDTATARTRTVDTTVRMRGYALQVGLFPTRDAAERRIAELRAAGLRPSAFPKLIAGKKNYAVVVGPYPSIEEANRHKAEVARICACKAFIVKVQ